MLTRNANVCSLTICEQPEVVEEFRWAGGGEGTWAPSAGLSAAGRGHRPGLTGCSLLAAFSGRRKTGSDSSCSPRMLNQPWWVSDGELFDSATFCMLTYCTSSSSRCTWMTPSLCLFVTPPGWQVATEEIRVWEDGGPLVRDQTGAITQRETLPGSTTEG